MVRYVLKSECTSGKFTSGVFAFPYSGDQNELAVIDKQAGSYFRKHDVPDARVRWFGTMQGWFFKIPGYDVPEGFGDMRYERSGGQCDF